MSTIYHASQPVSS